MAPGKKSKGKGQESVNSKLQLVMKSGKSVLGYKTVVKALRTNKAKILIISSNTPPLRKSELEYYALLAKAKIIPYSGNNQELGTACGKYYRVGCMSILDPGDSDIMNMASE
jgi:large subunit ribosomal protein L30e|mmetsp:Transcript_2346/g.3216  ORF Transcript_2346/g.3216 Transcript_2346/m.3216 type:complete len:112 (-) Transcript_2346:43-378(-)